MWGTFNMAIDKSVKPNNKAQYLDENEAKAKYKTKKLISLGNLVYDRACDQAIVLYVNKFYTDEICVYSIISEASMHEGWIEWLIEKGYIEEIKEEFTINIGDVFRRNALDPYVDEILVVNTKDGVIYHCLNNLLTHESVISYYTNIEIKKNFTKIGKCKGFIV